jgi:hypothetical protein
MIFSRKPIVYLVLITASVFLFQSCIPKNKFFFVFNRTSVKNPPKDTFVFSNEIHITPGIISKDEQNRLEYELNSYWDDSVKARTVQQFAIFYRVKNPQRFDTFALERSKIFMNSFLQSQGYYNAVLNDTFRIDTFRLGKPTQQFRAIPVMNINPGKRLKIDSVAFSFIDTARPFVADSILQTLALQRADESLLHKGDNYSKPMIAAELDRLVSWFRQNGYYRFNRENLVALVDTTDQLIDSLTIDPFELARKISEAAERRKQNPTADVELMQATKAKEIRYDTTVVTRYHIGNIYYYPELGNTDIPDSVLKNNRFNTIQAGDLYMRFPGVAPKFNIRPLVRHTFISKGELYDERLFFKTINTLNQMGPWQQVEMRDSLRQDTVDFHIFLTPNKKRNIKFNLEVTRSSGDFAASNNLFGVGGNATYLDRNFLHKAIQWVTAPRVSVELNLDSKQDLLQTVQAGVGTSFIVPHLFVISAEKQKKYDAARAVINLNASYTERKDFYRLRSLTLNAGNEKTWGNLTTAFRFPNIELYSLDTLPKLIAAFQTNPFLRTAFNTGSVISVISTLTWGIPSAKPNRSHTLRVGGEYAGLTLPWWIPALKKNLFHYIKGEVEFTNKWQINNKTLIGRGFLGVGYNLNNDPVNGTTLPFFKQFIAGGPTSMRAWGLRQLGLGSSQLSELATDFRDRFGDLQIEFNGEYRFPIADVSGTKFSSALFADLGNIWNIKNDPANPQGTFKPGRFINDLALAVGTGLRVNVANFIFRIDFAVKARDPARRDYNGWLNPLKFTWKNENDRTNYAFQIGIGLPF